MLVPAMITVMLKIGDFTRIIKIPQAELRIRINMPTQLAATVLEKEIEPTVSLHTLEFELTSESERCPTCGTELPVYELILQEEGKA